MLIKDGLMHLNFSIGWNMSKPRVGGKHLAGKVAINAGLSTEHHRRSKWAFSSTPWLITMRICSNGNFKSNWNFFCRRYRIRKSDILPAEISLFRWLLEHFGTPMSRRVGEYPSWHDTVWTACSSVVIPRLRSSARLLPGNNLSHGSSKASKDMHVFIGRTKYTINMYGGVQVSKKSWVFLICQPTNNLRSCGVSPPPRRVFWTHHGPSFAPRLWRCREKSREDCYWDPHGCNLRCDSRWKCHRVC